MDAHTQISEKDGLRLKDLREVISDENLQLLLEDIKGIRYGSVTLTIQDGKAVQIEKNEKIRIR